MGGSIQPPIDIYRHRGIRGCAKVIADSEYHSPRPASTFTFRRTQMAKGQMRSNREQKKPKKDKTKPAVPALPFGGAQGKSSIPTPIKK